VDESKEGCVGARPGFAAGRKGVGEAGSVVVLRIERALTSSQAFVCLHGDGRYSRRCGYLDERIGDGYKCSAGLTVPGRGHPEIKIFGHACRGEM
jgi:hypothetical protein